MFASTVRGDWLNLRQEMLVKVLRGSHWRLLRSEAGTITSETMKQFDEGCLSTPAEPALKKIKETTEGVEMKSQPDFDS